jgi:hypothetical protein
MLDRAGVQLKVEAPPEAEESDLKRQNPAAKKLVEEMDDAFSIMMQSLVKQVNEALRNSK